MEEERAMWAAMRRELDREFLNASCSTAAPNHEPSLTLEELEQVMMYFQARSRGHITYQLSEYVPAEMRDEAGEIKKAVIMPNALSHGRPLAIMHPDNLAEFVEWCEKQGIAAVPVDWKRDLPLDRWMQAPAIQVR